ncbi:MAG: S-methyl-5-thioribose-1-phosphate isomerase [Candidatus Thorarchaeota archaeon]
MQITIDGNVVDILAVQMENYKVTMIDQRWLPFKIELKHLDSWQDTVKAIKDLVTRGAGSVGVAGAFAMAQAAHEIDTSLVLEFNHLLQEAAEIIKGSRPTAVTLSAAVSACLTAAEQGTTIEEKRDYIEQAAQSILASDIHASKKIGKTGAALLKPESRVLTHCNTGPLAMQDYGSALSVIRFAYEAGTLKLVYVSETRPWLQGSRLTTWELQQANIPHQLIVDSACGFLFNQGMVDAVIVGADRIVANGDVANKIGTYEKALLAHVHKVPFYVAAPLFAFDLECPDGSQIVIEERPAKEVRTVVGRIPTGGMGPVQVAPDKTDAFNPVFDITPAKYVTGFITEKGVLTKIKTKEIRKFVEKSKDSS